MMTLERQAPAGDRCKTSPAKNRQLAPDAACCVLAGYRWIWDRSPAGLALERHHLTVDPARLETRRRESSPIGDVAAIPASSSSFCRASPEAAMAAHAAHGRVFPGQALHFEYSTSKGVPGA